MEYKNLELLIAKIENQQKGKGGTPEFAIGEQLKEIVKAEPESAELVDQDIEREKMGLVDVAAAFKKYADDHHKKEKVFCITPQVAEDLIRKFYGLTEKKAEQIQEKKDTFLDLGSFL